MRIWLQRLKNMRLIGGITDVIPGAELFRRIEQADQRPPVTIICSTEPGGCG
jgi:hypothetical protein